MKTKLHLSGEYFVEDNTSVLGIKNIPLTTSLELTNELLSFKLWSEDFWKALENWFRVNIDNRCIQFNNWTIRGWIEVL